MEGQLELAIAGASMRDPDRAAEPGTDLGEVFTRHWVVELILDLAGYTPDRDLGAQVVVEPSCGTGAFLLPVVRRLIESSRREGRDLRTLSAAVRAFDVLGANADRARKAVACQLEDSGLTPDDADGLAADWVSTGDFLLDDHRDLIADYVVGNPPYVRLEHVPRTTMEAYRRACRTMRGRSDLYVGFMERALALLRRDGTLAFICADRWMHNQYGADLRELVSSSYAVDTVLTMHDVDAFEDHVSAYPAVVVLRRGPLRSTVVAEARASFGHPDAGRLVNWARGTTRRSMTTEAFAASKVGPWPRGRDLWPAGSPAHLAVVADLEARFPPLQDTQTGTRVGIGLATGCDEVFITRDTDVVEEDRLLPLLQAGDISTGTPVWSGTYLVNPWDADGLVDIARFPRMEAYLRHHEARLRARHVARRRPSQWFRTIDRVDDDMLGRPHLVLPDLKAAAHPVLEPGDHYPHHNLYCVVSDGWDLEVLGGLLLSDVANLFVGAYCVKMRGGCYRFQAQYLRRIRVPAPEDICMSDRRSLASAFAARDVEAATGLALRIYDIRDMPTIR